MDWLLVVHDEVNKLHPWANCSVQLIYVFCGQTFSVKKALHRFIPWHKFLILLQASILLQAGSEMKMSSNIPIELLTIDELYSLLYSYLLLIEVPFQTLWGWLKRQHQMVIPFQLRRQKSPQTIQRFVFAIKIISWESEIKSTFPNS